MNSLIKAISNRKSVSLFLAGLLVAASIVQPLQVFAQAFVSNRTLSGTGWDISSRSDGGTKQKRTSIGACGIISNGERFWLKTQKGENRLDSDTGRKILNMISLHPAEKPESALAMELQIRLGSISKHADFFDNKGGYLKLTSSGCRKIIDLIAPKKSGFDISNKEISISSSTGKLDGEEISLKLDDLSREPFLGDSFYDGAVLAREISDEINVVEMDEGSGDYEYSESSDISDRGGVKSLQSRPPALKSGDKGLPPMNTWKGRFARTFGIIGAAAGIGAASGLLWGPAAMAYHMSGSVIKSLKFNSDLFGKAAPSIDVLDDYSVFLRMLAGSVMMSGGVLTGNPVAAYFGVSFVVSGIGDFIGKMAYDAADEALQKPSAIKLGRKLDDKIKKRRDARNKSSQVSKKRSKLARVYNKIESGAYKNRGKIARTVLASAFSIGVVCGFAGVTHAAFSNSFGKMAIKKGELTALDKARNTAIGAYRFYNLPGTVFKSGENTNNFYAEMKAKYKPETPESWANVVENEITWVSHSDLYGVDFYYLSSEEAAKTMIYEGLSGRYSDCTGKAALLQNMLKMDGFGSSEIVLGTPKFGSGQNMGHAWLIRKDSGGNVSELFHYDNTKNLLYSQRISASQGIKGDNMAETAGGGIGGLLTDLVYESYSNGKSNNSGGGLGGMLTRFVYKAIGGEKEEGKKKA